MRKLALGALVVGLLAACGGTTNPTIKLDGGSGSNMDGSGSNPACNILTQTGCNANEKCSWVHLQTMPQSVSDVECAPDGTVDIGGACTYGMPPMGWDNCKKGGVCEGGVCKLICDQQGGAPTCDAMHSCQTYAGFLGPEGSEAAGVCDPTCHPLDDNMFGGTTRTGTACGSGEGCYGFWSSSSISHFSCASVPPHGATTPPPGSMTLFHRAACATASGCANGGGTPYLNGCAGGYMPEITDDMAGSSTYVCVAFCKPADCSTGACGANGANRVGAAPHRCTQADAMGTFNGTANGDQCVYGWWFEQGSDGTVLKSNFTDTTGLCLDHTKYHLADSTGMTATNDAWPACSNLPLTATGSNCFGGSGAAGVDGCEAADFGCVSTTTGGITTTFQNNSRNIHVIKPRFPYHQLFSPHAAE